MVVSLGLNLYGSSWGLPATYSWSNDDITPKAPLRAVEVWRDGWYKYPNLQPLVLRAAWAPWLAAWNGTGRLDRTGDCAAEMEPSCFATPVEQSGTLMFVARVLAAAMGTGTVVAVWLLARGVGGGLAAAAWAAGFAACTQALVFYAHVGNVDGPQTFWFAWSLLAFVAALRGNGAGHHAAFGAFGVLGGMAISTKEGIYGAYVLPAAALAWLRWTDIAATAGPGAGGRARALGRLLIDGRLVAAALAVAGVYALVQNAFGNPAGLARHVGYWLEGPGIADWNEGYRGPLDLAHRAWRRLGDAMGRPLLWWTAVGAAWVAVRRPAARPLLLAALSYGLFTLLAIRYVYVRFTLPLAVVLCVCGGLMAEAAGARHSGDDRRIWRVRDFQPLRVAAQAVAAIVLAHSFLYSLHAVRLMARDARYGAEEWLEQNVVAEAKVVYQGSKTHLPRFERVGLDAERIEDDALTTRGLLRVGADVLVLSEKNARGLDGEAAALRDAVYAGSAIDGGWRKAFDLDARSGLEPYLWHPFAEDRISPRIVIARVSPAKPVTASTGAACSRMRQAW